MLVRVTVRVVVVVTVRVVVVVIVRVVRSCVLVGAVRVSRVGMVKFSLMSFLVFKQVLLDFTILDLRVSVRVTVRMIVTVRRVRVRVTVSVLMIMMMMSSALFPWAVIMFAAQVVVSVARVQNFHLNQIENEAHHCNDEHDSAFDLRRLEEAHSGFTDEPHGHDPDGGHRDECADDFSAMPPVSQMVRRGSLAQGERRNRNAKAKHVRGKMCGIGENGD